MATGDYGWPLRLYIFDESQKYVPEEYPERVDFLAKEVEYIYVHDMDEIKENRLNRKSWYWGIYEYGVMPARNKLKYTVLMMGLIIFMSKIWAFSRNTTELQYR